MSNDKEINTYTILKHDSNSLFRRIKYKKIEYLYILSAERKRTHFDSIFKSIYSTLSFDNLVICDEGVIHSAHLFYTKCDELEWYLRHTEDLPMKVESKVNQFIKDIEIYFSQLETALTDGLQTLKPNQDINFEMQKLDKEESSTDTLKKIDDKAYEDSMNLTDFSESNELELPPPPASFDIEDL